MRPGVDATVSLPALFPGRYYGRWLPLASLGVSAGSATLSARAPDEVVPFAVVPVVEVGALGPSTAAGSVDAGVVPASSLPLATFSRTAARSHVVTTPSAI